MKSLAFGVDALGLLGILLEKGLVVVYDIPLEDSTFSSSFYPLKPISYHLPSLGLSAATCRLGPRPRNSIKFNTCSYRNSKQMLIN